MTDAAPDQPKHDRNRKWRDWNVTKNRPIRLSDADWYDYDVVCKADGTDRSADIRDHVQRRVRAYRRKNPGTLLPSDTPGELEP